MADTSVKAGEIATMPSEIKFLVRIITNKPTNMGDDGELTGAVKDIFLK